MEQSKKQNTPLNDGLIKVDIQLRLIGLMDDYSA